MSWSISDLLPPWGSSGERPADGFQYDGGDQVNEKHLDYLWSQANELENEIRDALQDLDSDQDGVVDESDDTNLYKGNDIDSDGDGTVDSADSAASATDATNVTSTYKGNDIDTNGDGTVNEAAQLDGFSGEDLNQSGFAFLPDTELGVGGAHVLFRLPGLSGTLEIETVGCANDSFNTPTGLDIVVYDETADSILQSYNTSHSTVNDSINLSGNDVLVALDNGNFGSGTGSNQQASAHITTRIE